MQKFAPRSHVGIFHNERTQSTKSCYGVFHSAWVHMGSFRNCMKLVAKQTELVQLMQKFVPQSRVGIFRNDRTQSIPLDPKLMFWCVSKCLGAYGIVS